MKICGPEEDTLLDEAECSTAHSESMESVKKNVILFSNHNLIPKFLHLSVKLCFFVNEFLHLFP